MAALLHAPLLMLTTLMVALNLSLSPMLVHTLQNDTEIFSVQKIGAPEALQYAVSKYNENSDDLYQDVVVEVKDTKFQHEEDGTKYLFHVILGESICLKSKSFFASCPLHYPLQRKICHFEVYVEQLENQMSLTNSKCNRICFHLKEEAGSSRRR
ncbi:cystatin-S-like [Chionomys nivalis]|uniref:cystatin-S-like n=1 Tax=Chionomys nivalis TaxID=269649 RepID=UPI002592BC03|nr:cystatin-S-like [Chionomys nivalis]